jgi:hypothetical protein
MTKTFTDGFPVYLWRACSAASGDGGLRAWLDEKFGPGKWALCEYPRNDIEVALSSRRYADLCVEYGFQRLVAIFASADPVAAAHEGREAARGNR